MVLMFIIAKLTGWAASWWWIILAILLETACE